MHVEHRYPVSPGVLLGVLLDPTFLMARNERYGGAGPPSIDRKNGQVVVTVPRQLPLEHVPSPFRRFVGDGRFVQIDTWAVVAADTAAGSWIVDAGKAPIALSGRHTVEATADGCRHIVTGDITVSVPVVGGALMRQVGSRLIELVGHELAFAAEWLEGGQAS